MTAVTTNHNASAPSATHTTLFSQAVSWITLRTVSVAKVPPAIIHNPILRTLLMLFIALTVVGYTSTQTQTSFFLTSTNPPCTSMLCLPSLPVYTTIPSVNEEMMGAWLSSISNCPSVPGTITLSMSPSYTTFSGLTILSFSMTQSIKSLQTND